MFTLKYLWKFTCLLVLYIYNNNNNNNNDNKNNNNNFKHFKGQLCIRNCLIFTSRKLFNFGVPL
jgi:hypothetical protein